eukprot:3607028-Pleurochrysis_carterae.AAC.1
MAAFLLTASPAYEDISTARSNQTKTCATGGGRKMLTGIQPDRHIRPSKAQGFSLHEAYPQHQKRYRRTSVWCARVLMIQQAQHASDCVKQQHRSLYEILCKGGPSATARAALTPTSVSVNLFAHALARSRPKRWLQGRQAQTCMKCSRDRRCDTCLQRPLHIGSFRPKARLGPRQLVDLRSRNRRTTSQAPTIMYERIHQGPFVAVQLPVAAWNRCRHSRSEQLMTSRPSLDRARSGRAQLACSMVMPKSEPETPPATPT